jgi:hypothetical protein
LPGYSSLDRAAEYARAVKLTRVTGWPLCARCHRVRTTGLVLASLLFFGGVATIVVAFVLRALADGPRPMLLAPMLGAFAAMLVSPVALRWGGLPRLTRTETTADGAAVSITEPHPEFAGQLQRLFQP